MNCKICGKVATEFAPKGQVWLCKTCKRAFMLGYRAMKEESDREIAKMLDDMEESEERRIADIREEDAYWAGTSQ